jgi:methanogenic corrinoid protein MtbC1
MGEKPSTMMLNYNDQGGAIMMASIIDFEDEAKYNIKAVSQKTEIQSVTIRAWERRYQLLNPRRAENGYRLYSDRDIAILNWIKKQVDGGISISSASAELKMAVTNQNWPEAVINEKGPIPSKKGTLQSTVAITEQFIKALCRIDERMASDIFSEALGSLNLLQLCESFLIPTLVEIGSCWERGDISVAVEHFASNLISGRIQAIYQSLPLHSSAPKVIVGCGPEELHEIGSLMFAALLRNLGYRVEFLGPDIPLEDLALYLNSEKPKLVILSATLKNSALKLIYFGNLLKEIIPSPLFGFGGAAFNANPELVDQIPGIYLGRTFSESLVNVQALLPVRSHPISH